MKIARSLFILTAALLIGSSFALAGRARAPKQDACSETTKLGLASCQAEAHQDLYLELGRCENVADEDAGDACEEAATEAYDENLGDCSDQADARAEICAELGEAPYDPVIDPANFVDEIDNPLLPFQPGTTWTYEGETEDGTETNTVEVTHETKVILGVPCVDVHDRVYLDGDLTEDTHDWYAQDLEGNVWYFGERSYELEDGVIVSLEGSWEAGVDGAHPGIVMPAVPVLNAFYRQEFLLGEAEDMAEAVDLNAAASVPYGDFVGCLQTREWTPLEPDVFELKVFCPGVGEVLEENPDTGERTELIDVSTE